MQHSVHYIAGPETGYRVLKNVKGPHLPTVYPFGRPEIIPPDFYDYIKDDVFDTAASGLVKPINNNVGGRPKPDKDEGPSFEGGTDFESDLGKPGGDTSGSASEGLGGDNKPSAGSVGGGGDDSFSRPPSGGGFNRPPSSGGSFSRPPTTGGAFKPPPSGGDFGDGGDEDADNDDFEGELFGPAGSSPKPSKPPKAPKPSRPSRPSRPIGGGGIGDGSQRPSPGRPVDDGSYKPDFGDTGDDGSYIPPGDVNQDDGSYKPNVDESGLGTGMVGCLQLKRTVVTLFCRWRRKRQRKRRRRCKRRRY